MIRREDVEHYIHENIAMTQDALALVIDSNSTERPLYETALRKWGEAYLLVRADGLDSVSDAEEES